MIRDRELSQPKKKAIKRMQSAHPLSRMQALQDPKEVYFGGNRDMMQGDTQASLDAVSNTLDRMWHTSDSGFKKQRPSTAAVKPAAFKSSINMLS